jgi:hypothetical protein
MIRKIFLIPVLLFSAVSIAAANENPWELKRDEQGIKVYTRPVAGSPLFEYRAEMIVDAEIEKAVELYENIDGMPRWFHRCIEASAVKKVSNDEIFVYFAADLSWPFFDRDGVYRQIKTIESGSVVYTLHSAPDEYPLKKNRVRVRYLDAEWRFTPLPGGKTAVNYRTHTAPGGYIHPSLINRFVVSLPFKTFVKFRARLKAAS